MNCRVFYPNGDEELLDLSGDDYIFRIAKGSHLNKIFRKVTNNKDNGVILQNTGYHPLYYSHNQNGTHRQCGMAGNGTEWSKGIFGLTIEPNIHQFESKVVMSYIRKPRAQFFSAEEQIGVVRGNYWLTSNKSLPILLNSRLFEHFFSLFRPNERGIPQVILKAINFEGLTAQTEDEVYQHYGLTEEEINWLKNYNRNEI
jgi:hypothetical protein